MSLLKKYSLSKYYEDNADKDNPLAYVTQPVEIKNDAVDPTIVNYVRFFTGP